MSSDTSVASADIPGLEAGRARWRTAVAGVLSKGRAADALPAEPERLLDTPTYEGFDIHALYTALDAVPQAPLPGSFPFTRGGDADRDVLTGWRVMEAFPAPGVAAGAGNAAVLGALSDGVSGLVLRIGPHGIPADDVDRHLEGVFLELVPVVLDAGTDLLVAADAVLDLVAALPADKRSALSIDCGADPLTAGPQDSPELADVVTLANRLAEYGGGVRTITVDGAESVLEPEDLTVVRRAVGDLLVKDRAGNWTYQFVAAVDDFVQGVTLVVRGDSLERTMSHYLIEQLREIDNVTVRLMFSGLSHER